MKVIVPIDDKPSSQSAIDTIMGMRWAVGTEIKLLTVVQPHDGSEERTDSSAVEEIERMAIELQSAVPYCEVALFVREGDPKTEIIELATEVHADLILMGSNCKRGLERLLLGSVSQAVLNSAHCPVIITKPDNETSFDPQVGFKCILIPMDDSVWSDVALRWLANFSWDASTRFILVTVADAVPKRFATTTPAEAARIVDQHRDVLELAKHALDAKAKQLAAFLRTNNIFVEIGTGEAAESIIDLAQTFGADLIVMGSHGRTGIKKLILGSVSQAVSQNAPCSVAVVRGILSEDQSWSKTGVFTKVKVEPPKEPKKPRNNDRMPHVFPGGMG